MKYVILIGLLWIAGSYGCYRIWGTSAILPYAGVTMVAAGLGIWAANRKPKAGQ